MKETSIIPGKNIVVCEPVTQEKLPSGLVLPAAEKGAPELGIVLKIGPGKPPVAIKKGDQIVYRKYTDNKVPIRGKDYNFVEFKDLLAVVK